MFGNAVQGTGNALDNWIYGNALGNTLDSGGAADHLIGGAGDDVYIVHSGGDQVFENPGEGFDTVESFVTSYTLPDNVEDEILFPGAVTGIGNSADNWIYGNSYDNIIDGSGGSDHLIGGPGNDTYYVNSSDIGAIGDQVTEYPDEGIDSIFSSLDYQLPNNVEYLVLTGNAVLGIGNSQDNYIAGDAQDNVLDGLGGADTLYGGLGNDTFLFRKGETNGDVVWDFHPNSGSGEHDYLEFVGFGTVAQGASFVQLDATRWQVNSADATAHEVIRLENGAVPYAGDVFFI